MLSCVGIGSPFILVMVAVSVLCYKMQSMLQSAVSQVVIYIFHSLLAVCFSVVGFQHESLVVGSSSSSFSALSTVKQGILYWTCTGPDVNVIGLVPTCD